ncbi:MAG: YraN family protein [Clostridiales bacterium]|nr:YraN family protein [Clostridiales bacterium]
MFTAKEIGNKGESYAVKFLKKKKYKILERNYSKKYGEIDIIAKDKEYIIFVEVKTRHENPMTSPVDAVDKRKQKRIIKTAAAYLAENRLDVYCRFDVCEVFVNSDNLKLISINYIKNAFKQEGDYAPY